MRNEAFISAESNTQLFFSLLVIGCGLALWAFNTPKGDFLGLMLLGFTFMICKWSWADTKVRPIDQKILDRRARRRSLTRYKEVAAQYCAFKEESESTDPTHFRIYQTVENRFHELSR
jgi:hypothetical protein